MFKPGCMARYAVAITLLLGASSPALAQNLQNAGSIGQRLPGELVSEGIARQQGAIISPRITPEITEPAPTTPSPRHQFFIDAIQTIFDQVNAAILLFTNVLRAQLGGVPLLPTLPDITSPPATTGTTTTPTTTGDAEVIGGTTGATTGAATGDAGLADPGGATSTGQAGDVRNGGRARVRRTPGHLVVRQRPQTAVTTRKR
ncbi:MAG: hypothetical protein ACE5E5_16115 [Phycisphaerae bacterium]